MKYTTTHRYICTLLLVCSLSCSSCFSYRVATQAQGATDYTPANTRHAYSLFWGLLQKPQVITTPVCDAMGVNGVAEVIVKANFGDALLTFITLGVYCPVTVRWKCAKPCQQVQRL